MPEHVAILHRRYLNLILSGVKTLECRLTRTARAPFGQVRTGERLHLKAAGGGYIAHARAGDVIEYTKLTPSRIKALFRKHNSLIHADQAYQRAKTNCRYATLIELCDVQPTDIGPMIPPSHGIAWFVLDDVPNAAPNIDDDASPALNCLIEVTLTEGALRNSYVRVPRRMAKVTLPAPGEPLTLYLPDGRALTTTLTPGGMVRWRGWGLYFRQAGLQSRDRVVFVPADHHAYLVQFHRHGQSIIHHRTHA